MVFTKRYASSQRYLRYQHEQAYLLAKGIPQLPSEPVSDVLPWTYTHNRLHPTQKPISVLKPLIEAFSAAGELVLDPSAVPHRRSSRLTSLDGSTWESNSTPSIFESLLSASVT